MVQTSPVHFLRARFLILRLKPKIAHRINSRFLVIVDYTHVFGKLELQCRERESAIPPKISPFLPPMPFLAPFFPFGRDENCPRPKPRRRWRLLRRHLSLIFSAQKPKRNDEFVVAILSLPFLSRWGQTRTKMMQTCRLCSCHLARRSPKANYSFAPSW